MRGALLLIATQVLLVGCAGPDGHGDFGDPEDPDNIAVMNAILDEQDRREGRFLEVGAAFAVAATLLLGVPQRFFPPRRVEAS